ncbi:MAG: GNAT family N-acetyltransferase [Chloroherpetonaceae bacterium]|nr:GNAT family N-acetyltransferase [Chloroherpetonaceae bacterium]
MPNTSPLSIRFLTSSEVAEFRAAVLLLTEVFEHDIDSLPPDAHLSQLLSLSHFFVGVAFHEGTLVGALTAHKLESYYAVEPQFYLYDIAVRPEFQRKGIGKALVTSLNELARKHGASEVFVQADAEDIHALDFYRHTGGREAPVFHYTFPLE